MILIQKISSAASFEDPAVGGQFSFFIFGPVPSNNAEDQLTLAD